MLGDQVERAGDAGIVGVPIAKAVKMVGVKGGDPATALPLEFPRQGAKLQRPP